MQLRATVLFQHSRQRLLELSCIISLVLGRPSTSLFLGCCHGLLLLLLKLLLLLELLPTDKVDRLLHTLMAALKSVHDRGQLSDLERARRPRREL